VEDPLRPAAADGRPAGERRGGRRFGRGLADQAVSSLTNFAVRAPVWWRQLHVALRESNIASAGLRLGQGPAWRHRIAGIARAEK
jgi:hypothetical protein